MVDDCNNNYLYVSNESENDYDGLNYSYKVCHNRKANVMENEQATWEIIPEKGGQFRIRTCSNTIDHVGAYLYSTLDHKLAVHKKANIWKEGQSLFKIAPG